MKPDCSALCNAFNNALGICMDPGKNKFQKLMALADAIKEIKRVIEEMKQ